MANCVMQISVNLETVHIDNPVHVPKVGEEVAIKVGNRTYEGVVLSVSYDFTDENEHYISVKAR